MSIAIKEGDKSRQFYDCFYLRTDKSGGGTVDWVLEDSLVQLKKKIKKNGTYNATDEKYNYDTTSIAAYGKVTVAIKKKSQTGKVTRKKYPTDPEPSTNEYTREVDDDGYFKEDKIVPSSIKITTEPSKLTYADGETIKKDGMVVKAYTLDGELWEGLEGGIIPLNEIKLEPTKADKSQSSEIKEEIVEEQVLSDIATLPIIICPKAAFWVESKNERLEIMGVNCKLAVWLRTAETGYTVCDVVAASDVPFIYGVGGEGTLITDTATYFDKTVYQKSARYVLGSRYKATSLAEGEYNPIENHTGDSSKTAWVMIYGKKKVTGGEEINVNWEREDDGKILSDKFNIIVT